MIRVVALLCAEQRRAAVRFIPARILYHAELDMFVLFGTIGVVKGFGIVDVDVYASP
ncbi:MAG: hypothetical protein K0V04_06525 [Deltaproteobacteria bacterium]|nr:hypothetical protein [Deltaproteobacteria bacterium]